VDNTHPMVGSPGVAQPCFKLDALACEYTLNVGTDGREMLLSQHLDEGLSDDLLDREPDELGIREVRCTESQIETTTGQPNSRRIQRLPQLRARRDLRRLRLPALLDLLL